MIDSETGLPYDWSNPGGGAAASTQPAAIPQVAPTQSAYAPPPFGQGAGQGGGLSPLLMQLLGNGVTPGSGMGAQFMPLLMRYLMGQQQPQQPQFGAPTPDQQSWMTQMGWGNDLNALTPMQRGGLNTALGTTNGPQALANAQYNTPQDFVSQWQQMFGRT